MAGPLPEGDALLDGGYHGAGEFWCRITQGIIPGGDGGLHVRFQIAQPAQQADDPPTDLLDDSGNVGVGRRCALEKAGLKAHGGAVEVDAFKKEDMEMQMHIQGAAKALDKGNRSRVEKSPLVPLRSRLVDIRLPDRGANNRMDLGGEVL